MGVTDFDTDMIAANTELDHPFSAQQPLQLEHALARHDDLLH